MKKLKFPLTIFVICGLAGLLVADEKVVKEEKVSGVTTMELHVTGMSCRNCADAVEDALAAVEGVEVESVDAKSNLAVVKLIEGKVTREQLVAAVKGTEHYVLESTVEYSKLDYESDGSFSLDGKPFTGTAVATHKQTGKMSQNYQFKEGKLDGLIREWYEDGQMASKKFYKAGKRHGLTEYWDENGEQTATKIYVDDVHVDENGNPVEE